MPLRITKVLNGFTALFFINIVGKCFTFEKEKIFFFFLEMNYFSFIIDTLFENEVLKKIIITVLLLNII